MTLETIPKTYSLLSIGQRGVGKTVFLAGSYLELRSSQHSDEQALWIDYRDRQTQENLDALLNYIARSGKYPPPTVRMTNFNFSLKQYVLLKEQTRCHFRWWDIPGEACSFDNADFRKLVFDSNGCCVFIDADALIHQPDYRQRLQEIRQQIIPIVTLVHLNRLNYAFAFLLTKCDRLEANTADQLQAYLHPLSTELNTLDIDYKVFYLQVPIVTVAGQTTLQAQGTAQPLLWLAHKLESYQQPASQPTDTEDDDPTQAGNVEGSLSKLFKSAQEARARRLAQSADDPKKVKTNIAALLVLAGFAIAGISWWIYTYSTTRPADSPLIEQE